MANLGAIAQKSLNFKLRKRLSMWDNRMYSEEYSIQNRLNIPVHGQLCGVVKEGETVLAYKWVYLYYEPTGSLIAKTQSDATGQFMFTGLNPEDTANYFAVAFHDRSATYNALVFRFLTPVVPT
jgi:hypothetical protein